ncbi:MAG: putative poly(beta-D-mannuronate) O-acetylase [Myxococcaceae bacterium]|nr:putative poly(beta-D-mannuronate) O-acetylase [Myxococcaceae bacterium]
MLFNSALYGVFLLGAFVVFWSLRKHRLLRVLFLVLASYGFYFYGTYDTALEQDVPLGPLRWSVLCLGIIFFGSTLDFMVGRALGRIESPTGRRALLLLSIFYYVGVLALFKYFNFAADSLTALLHAVGYQLKPVHLRLVLPFGISFVTFETMSYTIDVYRREVKPAERYLDYLLFVCFFPHLVAGPIVRPHQMLPQLAQTPIVDQAMQARGLFRIAVGLAKKIAIGDVLAVNIVGRVFDNPERYSSLEVLVAIYAYAFQIYADFSGYTDVALGSAALFGYELPENFDRPYLASDLQDFWRRWHMTLSSWLRDYVYIPLGGSRGSSLLTYRNLMLTMLLGGLWHGASWNFVIWGALHGVALAGTRMWQRARGSQPGLPLGLSFLLTFHYVCFAWIFFRAQSFGHAVVMLERMTHLTFGATNVSLKVVLVLAVAVGFHFSPRRLGDEARELFVRSPAWLQGCALAAAAYGLHFAAGTKAEPFVYGQF